MSKKVITSAAGDIIFKLKVLAREKEDIRRKLEVTAKDLKNKAEALADTARDKESIRFKLEVTAKELAATAREKESTKLKLAVTAKEKEDVRKKLLITAEKLAATAREKESTKLKLAVTAKEKEDVRKKLLITAEKLATTAKERESVRKKLVMTAKEKEKVREKLAVTARELKDKAEALIVTAKEKEDVRKKLEITAGELGESRKTLEQKVLERTHDLTKANARDEAILASIGDGIIATDSDKRIILMNKMVEKLLGWNIEEAIGKLYDEVVFLEDEKGNFIPPEERPIQKAFSKRATSTTTTTFYLLSKNKIKFPVAITVAPVILNDKIIGAVEVFRDITREKEVDKAKTEFVSLASHQLRTPLSAVNWYTEMLLTGEVGKLNTEQKKYLGEVYRGNQRMVGLVNALLNVSRLELGTFVIEPKPTDITKLVQDEIDEQKPQIDEKKIQLSPLFEKNIPLMQVDPKLLRMVVQNLLSNAVKYTPKGGKIELSITLDNKKKAVILKVSDTGCGIPKNQQDKIFTKLFRADNVKEKDTEGTGLGLYIVKSIIDHSGGKIWFSSPSGESSKNSGSTFYVTMPFEGMKKKEGTKQLS